MEDIEEIPIHELIGQYILELRGKGVCLPFQDYQVIQNWVQASQGHHSELLSILEDKLPKYFEGKEARPPGLKRMEASVLKEIVARL